MGLSDCVLYLAQIIERLLCPEVEHRHSWVVPVKLPSGDQYGDQRRIVPVARTAPVPDSRPRRPPGRVPEMMYRYARRPSHCHSLFPPLSRGVSWIPAVTRLLRRQPDRRCRALALPGGHINRAPEPLHDRTTDGQAQTRPPVRSLRGEERFEHLLQHILSDADAAVNLLQRHTRIRPLSL